MAKNFKLMIEAILAWQVKRLIKRHHPKIVAVTGSVGKTSTKSAIAHVLSSEYKVQFDSKSFNTAIGLPLAIFGHDAPRYLVNPFSWLAILIRNEQTIWSPAQHDAWVLEMGAERKGEIAGYLSYITPDIGVVTAVKQVHMESDQFRSIDEILAEKWQVAKRSQRALVNAEDAMLMCRFEELSDPITYGVRVGDYRWTDIKTTPVGIKGAIVFGKQKLKVQTKMIARHSLLSLAAAVAVADKLAVEPDSIRQAVESFAPVSGRMNPLPGRHGSLIIDDSYNSSPDTVKAALDTLYELPRTGRKIAILGSMNELGENTKFGHEQVGEYAAKVDLLITIGDKAREYLANAAKEAGLKYERIRSFDDPYRAGEFVLANLKKGDQVLVKGSQNGVFAEEAAKLLLARREDRAKLVRQTPAWLAKKKRAFGVK